MTPGRTRRAFLQLIASGLAAAACRTRAQEPAMSALAAVDHLLLGVADLAYGIDWVEKRTGVRAVMGGSHPGRGTRNALLALAGARYLEIIAPDPAQEAGALSGLRTLAEPTLIGWAAATREIKAVETRVRAAGVSSPGLRSGSRQRADGRLLKWTTLAIETQLRTSVDPIPFFIEWDAASTHPSQDSPTGCELLSLEFEHPQADVLRRTLRQIGIEATVRAAGAPRLVAALKTRRGPVTLT